MKRILLFCVIAVVCACGPVHASTIPVTGTIYTPAGTPLTGRVDFNLSYAAARDTSANNITVASRISYPVRNGSLPSNAQIVPNSVLTPGNTTYLVEYYNAFGQKLAQNNFYVSGQSFNLGTATPTTITTDNISFALGTTTLDCSGMSGATASAKIAACAGNLTSGGTADARGLLAAQSWNSDAFSGITQSIDFLCGATTYAVSVTSSIPTNVHLIRGAGCSFVPNSGITFTISGPGDGSATDGTSLCSTASGGTCAMGSPYYIFASPIKPKAFQTTNLGWLGIGTNGGTVAGALHVVNNVNTGDSEAARFDSTTGCPYISVGSIANNGGLVYFRGQNAACGSLAVPRMELGLHNFPVTVMMTTSGLGVMTTTTPIGALQVAGRTLLDDNSANQYQSESSISGLTPTLHLQAANATAETLLYDSYGTNNSILLRRADGTLAAPTAVQSGEDLGHIGGGGYRSGGAYTAQRATIEFHASENWTNANQGADIQFWGTPLGSTTPHLIGKFGDNGGNGQFLVNTSSSDFASCILCSLGTIGNVSAATNAKVIVMNASGGDGKSQLVVTKSGTGTTQPLEIFSDSTLLATFQPAQALKIAGTGQTLGTTVGTFAQLPGSPTEGDCKAISDGNSATFMAVAAGGGVNHVIVCYDGTNWRIH